MTPTIASPLISPFDIKSSFEWEFFETLFPIKLTSPPKNTVEVK